jgi:hypothetical protein
LSHTSSPKYQFNMTINSTIKVEVWNGSVHRKESNRKQFLYIITLIICFSLVLPVSLSCLEEMNVIIVLKLAVLFAYLIVLYSLSWK